MSIISLQFGQCGNQLGQSLYTTLEEDIILKTNENSKSNLHLQSLHQWFNINAKGEWEPRSILVDTETKVVKNIQNSSFKFNNVIAKSIGGSANNWAYGYTENSKLVVSEVLNYVRIQLEKSDLLSSFLNLYSVSGGTGSGVGSYIIEKLRTEYPKKNIINCAVLPFTKGEISTQAYNCLLNLTKLYSVGDCCILFQNERLLHICKYSLGLPEVSYSNINTLISQQIASALQPVNAESTQESTTSIINNLTNHPLYKFVQIRSEPNLQKDNFKFECSQQWSALLKAFIKQSRFDMLQNQHLKVYFTKKIVSNAYITRGAEPVPQTLLKELRESQDLVQWLPRDESVKVYSSSSQFLNYSKFFTNIVNSNNVVVPLNSMVDDAWTSFTHSAYLHHYSIYGVDDEYFLSSFQTMENIINNYETI